MMRSIDEDISLGINLPHNPPFDENKFQCDVYVMCREGLYDQLCLLLNQVKWAVGPSKLKQLLDSKYKDGSQECAPLLVAAREDYADICDLLIHEYQVDIETEGTIFFDGYKIEGATPLWCSAGSNNMTIVMMLIKFGANVNHATCNRSTPLRAACFDGRVEMVKLLLDHKADYNIANVYDNTCLMIAAYKGHKDVVTCLLEHGAPPNTRALCGNTALQFAAEHGNVEVIEELLIHGADVHSKNKDDMTPLRSAAERTQAKCVEFLLKNIDYDRLEKIESLELLGASFANDKDANDLERCYHYLKEAMQMRYCEPILKKVLPPPVPAYQDRVESTTLEELRLIKYDANLLQMESLAIRERILGLKNLEVPHQVIYRGAVFADSGVFDRSLELWLHAMSLRENIGTSISRDLKRFTQLFCQMIYTGVWIPVEVLIRILMATVDISKEIVRRKEPRSLNDEQQEMSLVSTYLIVVVAKVIDKCTAADKAKVYQAVYLLNKTQCKSYGGNTLLHLSVQKCTPIKDPQTRSICKFPSAEAASLLLSCGADPNALNKNGDTPLLLMTAYPDPSMDYPTIHQIISTLFEYGAHLDIANFRGLSPLDTVKPGVAEAALRSHSQLKLKCLAARAIRRYGIQYRGLIPGALNEFVEVHGARCGSPN